MISSNHGHRLKEKLEKRRFEILEAMGRGVEAGEYLVLVGQARGLMEAIKLSDEADYELSGE